MKQPAQAGTYPWGDWCDLNVASSVRVRVYVCPIQRLLQVVLDRLMCMAFKFLTLRARQAFQSSVIVLLLLASLGTRAEVRFDVFLGYDGTLRESTWFPVTCEVFNDGPTFNGFIEVSSANFGSGEEQRFPIELPTGTLKRVVIPTFASSRFSSIWEVRLIDSRGKLRAESAGIRPQRQLGWETRIMGALPRTPAGMVSLRSIKRGQPDAQPAAVRFQPQLFPDNPLVLEGMDALYLNSEAAVGLKANQANALLAWLNAGGHLIVGIEQISDVSGVPWLRGLLPVEPQDIVTVASHDELDRWLHQVTMVTNNLITLPGGARKPRTSGEPTVENAFGDLSLDPVFESAAIRVVTGRLRDAKVLVAVAGKPLIVTANRGLGRVTVLMFSPEREPFKSWKALPSLWTYLLGVPLELYVSNDFTSGYGQGVDGFFGAMIDSRQVHKLPVEWLLLLLVVYLLVIGPFDRMWLKKINRPMLTWITFPCYVVFFSGLIYLIGYKLRAGDSEYNELHLVDVLKSGDRAELRGCTYVSIYSPVNARYPMQSQQKFATFRPEYLGSRAGESSQKASLTQTGESFAAEVSVPVWTSQLFTSDWWGSADLPMSATLNRNPAGWSLTVKNQSAKRLADVRFAFAGAVYQLGEIPPWMEKDYTLATLPQVPLYDFVNNSAHQYATVANQRQYAFGRSRSGQIDEVAKASMVASLLGMMDEPRNGNSVVLPPGLDVSHAVTSDRGVLLAWSPDTAPVPRLSSSKTKLGQVNTLWRIPVLAATTP